MKIAVLHYHLRPGGVATVIRRQIQALDGAADLLVVTGEEPSAPIGAPVAIVPGIGYDSSGATGEPVAVAAAVHAAIRERFGGECDALHVHNPTLKKNSRFLAILKRLRDSGVNLFLHVHDLGEDGRPDSFFTDGEYPEDCHYGVLNGRDYRALLGAGLKAEGLHLLFNAVTPLEGVKRSESPSGAVYPVRAIRRKNIGEALLLSRFLPAGERLAVTLPPTSPRDFPGYEAWKAFAHSRTLPVRFDAGLEAPLSSLLSEARCVLTTSLKEGFGFAFLEPWTAGLPVAGRRLETVCPDFEAEGVCFPGFYGSIRVPRGFFSFDRFARTWRERASVQFRAFGRSVGKREIDGLFERAFPGGETDFGSLDEAAQIEAIDALDSRADARETLVAENPLLEGIFLADDPDVVAWNDRAVRERYSPERYRELLLGVYARVRDVSVRQSIDRKALLDFFLHGEPWRLIASGAVQ